MVRLQSHEAEALLRGADLVALQDVRTAKGQDGAEHFARRGMTAGHDFTDAVITNVNTVGYNFPPLNRINLDAFVSHPVREGSSRDLHIILKLREGVALAVGAAEPADWRARTGWSAALANGIGRDTVETLLARALATPRAED